MAGDTEPKPLTFKQRLFVDYYIGASNGNASDAARRAGYAKPGQQGYCLVRLPAIKEAISERYKEAAMGADEVLARLAKIARSSLRSCFVAVAPSDQQGSAEPLMIEAADVIDAEFTASEPLNGSAPDDEDATRSIRRYRVDINHAIETGAIHDIEEIRPTQHGIVVKLGDRQAALDKIARAQGLYKDGVEGQQTIIKIYKGVDTDAV